MQLGPLRVHFLVLIEFHKERKAAATIVLTRVPNPLQYGIVLTEEDGRIISWLKQRYEPGLEKAMKRPSITIGAGHPIAAQSMTATHTTDVEATVQQAEDLRKAGAGVVRIAVDSKKDAAALEAIRAGTTANLAVDLQENYRLAADMLPFSRARRFSKYTRSNASRASLSG